MKKTTKFGFWNGVVSLLVGVMLGAGTTIIVSPTDYNRRSSPKIPTGKVKYQVVRVIDGDTVVLMINSREERVRLLGVDTPETVKTGVPVEEYGYEASNFLKNLLTGEEVYMEYERTGRKSKDRYGRELAYIYRVPDGLFINLEIVRQGYGRVYRKSKFMFEREFIENESKAKKYRRGLWALADENAHKSSNNK